MLTRRTARLPPAVVARKSSFFSKKNALSDNSHRDVSSMRRAFYMHGFVSLSLHECSSLMFVMLIRYHALGAEVFVCYFPRPQSMEYFKGRCVLDEFAQCTNEMSVCLFFFHSRCSYYYLNIHRICYPHVLLEYFPLCDTFSFSFFTSC